MSGPHYFDIPEFLSADKGGDGGGFIVGVSGGIDSITLADMLYRQGLTHFALAHCNFHLRGEESDGDAAFVAEWAGERGIKFLGADFDTEGYATGRGVSIEMAARELRYGWFALLCRREGYRAVAIAHNANDNAETLLLNLVRGTGLRGICGMQTLSAQTICLDGELCRAIGCTPEESEAVSGGSDKGTEAFPEGSEGASRTLQIWRPLLQMTRKQIEGYALSHNLSWREDRTNADSRYKRNLIRNEVMPLLERLNPSVVKTLSRDMEHFSSAAAVLDSQFASVFGSEDSIVLESDNPDEALKTIQKMVSERSAGWKYALYTFLEARGFNPGVIAQVEDLLESSRTRSGKVFLSPEHRLLMTRDSFILEPSRSAKSNGAFSGEGERACAASDGSSIGKGECACAASDGSAIGKGECACAASEASAVEDGIIILSPGVYTVGSQKLTVELFDRPEDFPLRQPTGVTAIDADRASFPLLVRRWQDGDWMRPLGCRGRKKMSDLFTDLKFNAPEKKSALLLLDSIYPSLSPSGRPLPISITQIPSPLPDKSHVLALIGRRIDESVKITPATTHILRLSLTPAGE